MSRRTLYGKWEAGSRVPDSDGKWKQKTKAFLHKRDADAHEAKAKSEVKANVYVEATKDTFAVFLHHWLDSARPHIAESTQFTYQRYNDNYIIPQSGQSRSRTSSQPTSSGS